VSTNAFKAFGGAASRIDGKKMSSPAEKMRVEKEEEVKSETKTLEESTMPVVAIPTRQSLVGDKFSKKKSAVSAFTGTAYKFK
jgi:hypothetical protein